MYAESVSVAAAFDLSYRDLGQASALNELGMLGLLRGEPDRAQEYHELALDLARGIKSSWDEGQALAGLGRTARAAGRTAHARDRLREAQDAFRRAAAAAEEAQVAAELVALDDTGTGAVTQD